MCQALLDVAKKQVLEASFVFEAFNYAAKFGLAGLSRQTWTEKEAGTGKNLTGG